MRKASCCIALFLMLCIGGAAFAQDTMTVPCGDLSAEDCAILTNAQTASATIDSALYDFNFDLTVGDIPGMNEPLVFNLSGSGSYSGLAGLQELAAGMDMTDMSDMSDMAAMQEHLGQYLTDVFGAFNGDLNLTLTVPEELIQEAPPNTPNSVTVQVRLVDGIGYLNMDTLEPFLGDMGSMELSGWYGIDLVELIQTAMEEMPSDMLGDGTTFTMPNDAMMDYMAAFSDPEFLDSFMSVERTDDGSSDTAVFAFTFDFGGLMSSSAFQDMMRAQMESQMETMGTTMSEEEMGEMMAMTSQMFKGMTMTLTEEIGLEDGYLHSVTGSLDIDTAGMMAAISEMDSSGSSSEMEVMPTINITFAFNYSSFNSAPAVTAPEDATIVPLDAIFGGMMGGMGDMDMSGASAMEMTPTPTPSS